MDYTPMSKVTADEIAEEFALHGALRDGFDRLIAELEHALENPEFELQPVGGQQRYKELLQSQRAIDLVREMVAKVACDEERADFPGRLMRRILPVEDGGQISVVEVFDSFCLPRTSGSAVGSRIDDQTALAIAHYVLFRLSRAHLVETAFSAESRPRPRGRPRNKTLRRFVEIYIAHCLFSIGVALSYGERSACVMLCARLLAHYGIEAPDVAQTVKREIQRSR